jgi:hypothetical protein
MQVVVQEPDIARLECHVEGELVGERREDFLVLRDLHRSDGVISDG